MTRAEMLDEAVRRTRYRWGWFRSGEILPEMVELARPAIISEFRRLAFKRDDGWRQIAPGVEERIIGAPNNLMGHPQ